MRADGDAREKWVVALTPRGVATAARIVERLPGSVSYSPSAGGGQREIAGLDRLFSAAFRDRVPLICVMAAGIVVRKLAPFLRDKLTDPPVVVVDELGRYAISLLSGHMGGANRLALEVAEAIGAQPVITTATDLNGLPALELLAREAGLVMENREVLAPVAMAMLRGQGLAVVDPGGYLLPRLRSWPGVKIKGRDSLVPGEGPGVYVGDRIEPGLGGGWLILRPRSLVAGVGCNRGTPAAEILELLLRTLDENGLSALSLEALASIDLKRDEEGLLAAAARLGVELRFFSSLELSQVVVPSSSEVVERAVGTGSVCEAAAILGAGRGELVVPKRKTSDVTVAIARRCHA